MFHAPRRSLLAAAGGLLIAVLMLVIPLPAALASGLGPFGAALKDALHFPLFALLTICLFFALEALFPRFPAPKLFAVTALAAVVIAAGSEWIQGLTGRSASLYDFSSDLLGAAASLLALWIIRTKSARKPLFVTLAVVGIGAATAYAAAPAFAAWRAENAQRRLFPDLGAFDSRGLRFWRPQGAADSGALTTISLQKAGSAGREGLSVKCAPAAWSGVSKFLPKGTRDWAGYSALSLSIDNSGSPFVLGIRVDGEGSRVSAAIDVGSGTNHFTLPFNSDSWRPEPPPTQVLGAVTKLVLHTGESPVAHPFVLTDIRLVPFAENPAP